MAIRDYMTEPLVHFRVGHEVSAWTGLRYNLPISEGITYRLLYKCLSVLCFIS